MSVNQVVMSWKYQDAIDSRQDFFYMPHSKVHMRTAIAYLQREVEVTKQSIVRSIGGETGLRNKVLISTASTERRVYDLPVIFARTII